MNDQEKSFIYWLLEGVTGDADMASDIRLKLKQDSIKNEWQFKGRREYKTIVRFKDLDTGDSFRFNGIKMMKIHMDRKYMHGEFGIVGFATRDNGVVSSMDNHLMVEKIR